MQINTRQYRVNGGMLKIIATVAMFIDHLAFTFYAVIPETLYAAMRIAGRAAFPLYILLLTMGYKHTRSPRTYAVRLLILAVLSEIPYDLMTGRTLCNMGNQNVVWTLLLSLIMLYVLDELKKRGRDNIWAMAGVLAAACLIGVCMKSDYGCEGPLFSFIASRFDVTYSDQKRPGAVFRYAFYAFYPVHMLVLSLLRDMCIG